MSVFLSFYSVPLYVLIKVRILTFLLNLLLPPPQPSSSTPLQPSSTFLYLPLPSSTFLFNLSLPSSPFLFLPLPSSSFLFLPLPPFMLVIIGWGTCQRQKIGHNLAWS
eukprot:Phypoly_transcript_24810.p1 GENE.Phypoly_transcript_24810~~Phypoly_transcript_24810.p1  ORF type:complete len:108 (+),score=21.63 Phypoly_transcript_24810:158-481(+)